MPNGDSLPFPPDRYPDVGTGRIVVITRSRRSQHGEDEIDKLDDSYRSQAEARLA